MATHVDIDFARRGGLRWPAALALLAALAAVACGADEPASNPIIPIGGGQAGTGGTGGSGGAGGSAGSAGGGPDCFMNPKTHHEIINACTNAAKVKKTPNLKGLNADSSLPPPP